jgi:hypothetical protein
LKGWNVKVLRIIDNEGLSFESSWISVFSFV